MHEQGGYASLRDTLQRIRRLWADKESDDLVQERSAHPRRPMPKFLYDWFLSQYGIPKIAGHKLVLFLQTLLFYREVPECRMMARFSEIMAAQDFPSKVDDDDLSMLPLSERCMSLYMSAKSLASMSWRV